MCVAIPAALAMSACSSEEEPAPLGTSTVITQYVIIESREMPMDRYQTLVSCIPITSDAIQDPNEIGLPGLHLPGLRKTIDSLDCSRAGFVAGSTHGSCTVLFNKTEGQDGRKGVWALKLQKGKPVYNRAVEQTGSDANSFIAAACL